MSGQSSDQVHRSTLGVYANILEQFNPGLQKLATLGNSYVQAFQALAVTSKAYFDALAKMGEQALQSRSSYSLGDILIEISESQRRLTAELEGVFCWFHTEVLQEMDNNVKLDKDYISCSRRRYEMEVKSQAAALEKQVRRGAYRDTQNSSDYMQFLWQSQQEALKEEERRFRFLAEKHCGLTQSILYLISKTAGPLQQRAERWRECTKETRVGKPHTPTRFDQDAALGARQPDGVTSQTNREQQPLDRLPFRGPSPQPRCPAQPLGLSEGKLMRAMVSHNASPNTTLLPFSQGQMVTVLVPEPQNGWLYGKVDGSSRQGWFPAMYIAPLEDTPEASGPSISCLQLNSGSSQDMALPLAPPPPPPLPVTTTPVQQVESSADSKRPVSQGHLLDLVPRGGNPFATVKLRPTATNDRSAPQIQFR